MSAAVNRQFHLAARPVGLPKRSDFEFVEAPAESPKNGEALVETLMISLDPAMRGWMNEGRSYIAPVGIGEVMRAGALGKVLESSDASLKPGDIVTGSLGVQSHATLPAKQLRKIDPNLAPLEKYLGVLGMPGMTAYFGLLDVCAPQSGETLVVSGAAGAVGQIVGQIGKIKGCRVVGIAGGPDKCEYVVRELGFDGCIDYKNEDLHAGLKTHCPDGVDIYFDNVGGEILDAVLTRIRLRARIAICGAISQYNNTGPVKGPANYLSLLVNRARMQGLVVFDYADRYGEGIRDIARWLGEGRMKSREDIVEGLETFPETLLKLFSGENFGKLILKV